MSGRLRLAPTRRAPATSASRARQEARPSWRAHRSCCSCKGLAPVLELVRCAYGLAPLLTLMAEFQPDKGIAKQSCPVCMLFAQTLPSLPTVLQQLDCSCPEGVRFSSPGQRQSSWPPRHRADLVVPLPVCRWGQQRPQTPQGAVKHTLHPLQRRRGWRCLASSVCKGSQPTRSG